MPRDITNCSDFISFLFKDTSFCELQGIGPRIRARVIITFPQLRDWNLQGTLDKPDGVLTSINLYGTLHFSPLVKEHRRKGFRGLGWLCPCVCVLTLVSVYVCMSVCRNVCMHVGMYVRCTLVCRHKHIPDTNPCAQLDPRAHTYVQSQVPT